MSTFQIGGAVQANNTHTGNIKPNPMHPIENRPSDANNVLYPNYNPNQWDVTELPMQAKKYVQNVKAHADSLSNITALLMYKKMESGFANMKDMAKQEKPVTEISMQDAKRAEEKSSLTPNTQNAQSRDSKNDFKKNLQEFANRYNALRETTKPNWTKTDTPNFEKLHNQLTTLVKTNKNELEEAGFSVDESGKLSVDDKAEENASSAKLFANQQETDETASSFGEKISYLTSDASSDPFLYINNDTHAHRPNTDDDTNAKIDYVKAKDVYKTKGMFLDKTN